MKVLVAGSGAMGSSFGHMLHKGGHEVTLCDKWDENIRTTNEHGLRVTDIDKPEVSPLKMYRPEEVTGEFDLVLFFTKSMGLEDMCQSVKHLVGENTKVLCILNGLGHLKTMRKYFADKHILMGVTVVTAKLLGPGQFVLSSHSNTEVQNIDPNEREACERVMKAFNDSGMPFSYTENIMWSTWRKACLNGTTNSVCALLDINMKTQGEMPQSKELVRNIVVEFAQVAKAEDNVDLDVDQITDTAYSFLTPAFAGYLHYPSMHQDLVTNRRPTEIDYLNGYVARKAQEFGFVAPYSDCITKLIHGKEKALGII